MQIPNISLTPDIRMPQLGFGLFQLEESAQTEEIITQAIRMGYRHFDTAHIYGNERSLGAALASSGISRDQFWITSKLWLTDYEASVTRGAIDRILSRLGTDYLDLLLLHHPFGPYTQAWEQMERALEAGKIRCLGLSNFNEQQLDEILAVCRIAPCTMQIECHPYWQQRTYRKLLSSRNIHTQAWYPLGHGSSKLLSDPVITEIAAETGKESSQVILRWHIQEGSCIFPRSKSPAHMQSNLSIFDFSLSEDQMERIGRLDGKKQFMRMSPDMQERYFGSMRPPQD